MKLHKDKSTSELYSLVLFKKSPLHVSYLNPTDFEVKNILAQIGELGKFPEIFREENHAKIDAQRLFKKVDTVNDLLLRQKIGYFGSSQFGIFSLVICFSGLPFS